MRRGCAYFDTASSVMYVGLWLFLEQSEEFTDPEDYGGAADDDYPVDEFQGFNVEEFSTDGDNQDLSGEDGEGYHYEAAASFQMEG